MLAAIFGVLLTLGSSASADHSNVAPVDTVKRPIRNNKSISPDSLGRYLTVDRIIIVGNKHTRNTIILRELSAKRYDVINEVDLPFIIQRDERKLFNLHLFNTAEISVLQIGNDKIDLLVEVTERWYFFPHPIFRLSDRNFNEWWENYNHDFSRVNYGIRAHHHNMRGRREDMLITAQFGFERKFQFSYQIPYINKKQKQGLIFDLDYRNSKNVADSTINHKLNYIRSDKILSNTKGIGLTYTYRNNFYIIHKLRYEFRETSITDTLQKLNENYLGEGRTNQLYDAVTYEFINDHRDVVAYPLHGYQIQFHIQKTGIGIHKDLNRTDGYAMFATFVDLKRDFFFSNMTFVYASTPDKVPYFNYGAMGYDKIFVKGYEVYVIEGPSYFLNKMTLKKKIFSRIWQVDQMPMQQFKHLPLAVYLKAYADFGYVDNYSAYNQKNVNTMLADKLIGGAGFGLDFVSSYDVVIRFEYTFTTQNTNGFFLHVKKEF